MFCSDRLFCELRLCASFEACSMAAADGDDPGVADGGFEAADGDDPGVSDAAWLEPKMEYDDGSEAEWPEESWGQSWYEDCKGEWWDQQSGSEMSDWKVQKHAMKNKWPKQYNNNRGKGYQKGYQKGYHGKPTWSSSSGSDNSRGTYVRDGFVNNRGDFFPCLACAYSMWFILLCIHVRLYLENDDYIK